MEVKVSGHLNVSQRSLRTAIPLPYLFSYSSNVRWGKKTYIYLFFSFIEPQNMAKTQLTPICANGSSPSIKLSQNEPIYPESNSGVFLFSFFFLSFFFAARLNFDLPSSPPRIAAWLHFCFPHKLNFLRKLWQVGYPDLDKVQWRGRHEKLYRSRTTEEPLRLPRTQGEILINKFLRAAFVLVGFLLEYVVKDWYTGQ